MRIMAIQLQTGQGLNEVVQAARDVASQDGVKVGDIVQRQIAGVPAAQWGLRSRRGAGRAALREIGVRAWRRRVAVQRPGRFRRFRHPGRRVRNHPAHLDVR